MQASQLGLATAWLGARQVSQKLGLVFSPASVLCKAARFSRGTCRAEAVAEDLDGSEAFVAGGGRDGVPLQGHVSCKVDLLMVLPASLT